MGAYQDLLREEATIPRQSDSVGDLTVVLKRRATFTERLEKALASGLITKEQYDELIRLNRQHSLGRE